ncbi:hypothetical protein JD844_025990 [Phrynosoma platyrhinos]|uniref:Sepiapterin reductase n=1 Tax=Phrynosoma platyrhinos TaxID=52577 RepID=A0ABQ7SEC9_PHRPL|nr:hypothetical protein JD844_025990 [Phrynosoma platyrhinos]
MEAPPASAGSRGPLGGGSLAVVSGASRGFGRSVAVALAARLEPSSALLLTGRSAPALAALQAHILGSRPDLRLRSLPADLSGSQAARSIAAIAAAAREMGPPEAGGGEALGRLLLVNNAGEEDLRKAQGDGSRGSGVRCGVSASLGDVSKSFLDFTDPEEVNEYLAFNVTSALCLTASLLKAFPAQPGLCRTVARTKSGDLELRQKFLDMKERGELLDCDVSSQKLLDLLLADTFESGAHIDFYDL